MGFCQSRGVYGSLSTCGFLGVFIRVEVSMDLCQSRGVYRFLSKWQCVCVFVNVEVSMSYYERCI